MKLTPFATTSTISLLIFLHKAIYGNSERLKAEYASGNINN